jgi:tetratricopeptide (TPR) repeat protein
MFIMRKILVASLGIVTLLSACTEPGDTTAIGATAGGVLGAGLGAIVGNQTGDTGTGLVIGGLAGAGAGAAVGNALEGQQVAIRQQDEAIERQQKTIQAQNAELKELRRSAGEVDRGAQGGVSATSGGKARYTWSSSREEALARSRSEALAMSSKGAASRSVSGSPSAGWRSGELSKAASRDMILNSSERNNARSASSAQERDSVLQKDSDLEAGVERRLSKAEGAIHDVDASERSGSLKERTIGISEEAFAGESGIDEGSVPGEDSAAESSGVGALSGGSPTTVECQQAAEEEANSLRATEPSQQLFHLRRALRLCPEDPRFHVALGKTYASMKREEDASFEYREALRMDSNYAPALEALEALNKKMHDGTKN